MKTLIRGAELRSYLPAVVLLGMAIYSVGQWQANNHELSSGPAATVDLAGTVTLDSEPLLSGVFELTNADGRCICGPIKNGTFHLKDVPIGEWQQSIQGPGVPRLYHELGPIAIAGNIRSIQFGLKGSEQLQRYALGLLDRADSE